MSAENFENLYTIRCNIGSFWAIWALNKNLEHLWRILRQHDAKGRSVFIHETTLALKVFKNYTHIVKVSVTCPLYRPTHIWAMMIVWRITWKKVKVKVPILVSRIGGRSWSRTLIASQPAGDSMHDSRLPLLSARPSVTFPAVGRHRL